MTRQQMEKVQRMNQSRRQESAVKIRIRRRILARFEAVEDLLGLSAMEARTIGADIGADTEAIARSLASMREALADGR